ncbi:YHS domain-containing (seleno)protein [Piscinibacter sakaiensis]|uniref:YHS domain-containing (seleno)protein n=1 Tax=Piscinibacter sakaiensis TaxID=1547922 RepID=UPI003AAD657D
MTRLRACLLLLISLLALAGCGTPWATVADGAGRPVMLLGHDPVAYFTQGRPTRGLADHVVDLPGRTYYFSSADNKALFLRDPGRFEPQYGGFCSSGAAYAVKLGSDPTAWTVRDGRLFIFGDVLGKTAWSLDPAWNIAHADRLWPAIADRGWRLQSLLAYADKVPHYLTGRQIKAQWEARHPGQRWPDYDPGGMITNLFLKPPGWRAAEGAGQPALGYPQ